MCLDLSLWRFHWASWLGCSLEFALEAGAGVVLFDKTMPLPDAVALGSPVVGLARRFSSDCASLMPAARMCVLCAGCRGRCGREGRSCCGSE